MSEPDPTPVEWTATEAWMKKLGARFVDVWFLGTDHRSGGKWVLDPQVADDDTFLECVNMGFGRWSARYALWNDGEKWCLLNNVTGDTKRYPTREAAKMVALHNG